tara:strand:+ start:1382 stop:1690 length:309 start_codon:yes stop_codon:yes gene_type:complete
MNMMTTLGVLAYTEEKKRKVRIKFAMREFMSFFWFVVLGGTLFDQLVRKQVTNLADGLFYATIPQIVELFQYPNSPNFRSLCGEVIQKLKPQTKGIKSCHYT